MMRRASKPRNQTGRYLSAADAEFRAAEMRNRELDLAALPQKLGRERAKDEALAYRKTQKKLGLPGRRDSGARALAKATGRTVTHRTFRSYDAAKNYLDKLPAKKSKLAWWGVSARDENDVLFSYQNVVANVDRSKGEIRNAQFGDLPTNGLNTTDLKVKLAVRSPDTRITVAVLDLNPPSKASASNAPKLGNKKGSTKPKANRRNGGGQKGKPSRKRPRKLAGTGKGKRTGTPTKRAKKR